MSLSSDEEEDQFLTGGPLPSDDQDLNDVSSSDLSDDESLKSTSHSAPPAPSQAHMLSFGPPYYGRPPTPLPPSPSLTSLLRPSRPTTPDASDDEGGHHGGGGGGGGGGTGLGHNGSNTDHHHPVPRASPKVPTYEYYGFVLYLFSSCCFLIYLLWSYLPSPFLHALGIHYYPDRWWSLATPAFIVVLLVYIYVALALYNTEYLTLPLHSLETIVDDAGKIAVVDGRGRIVVSEERRRNLEREREREGLRSKSGGRHHQRKQSGTNGHAGPGREREVDWRECWNEGTDAVMDVPLAGVCEILYGSARVEEQ
ncbi:unnamed protein product [Discula destructiva]